MKARLIRDDDELRLLLCNGQLIKISESDAKRFLLTYDYPNHYSGDDTWDYPISMADYDGETLAVVNDDGELIIKNADFLRSVLFQNEINYVTAPEYAEMHGKKRSIVMRHCREDRIPGATQVGTTWIIPENAPYPPDTRGYKKKS